MIRNDRGGKPKDDSHPGRNVVVGTVVKVGTATGHLALLPFRAAARTPLVRDRAERLAETGREVTMDVRHKLEDAAVGALETPDAERTIDRTLAGPLPETIARSAVQHRVLQRVIAEMLATADRTATITPAGEEPAAEELVQQALASPALERLMAEVAQSTLMVELTDQLTRSPAFHRALRNVLSSPEIRSALTEQTTGLAGEMQDAVRRLFEANAEYLRARFGARQVPQPELSLIPLGVDCEAFAPDPAAAARLRKSAIFPPPGSVKGPTPTTSPRVRN